MYQTTYHRASSIDEAAALFAKGTEAKYLAGGQTLLPVMKQRLAAPSEVIDLARIKDLVGVELSGDTLTIKAATTYYDITQSADAKKAIPAIVHLTSVLGDPGKAAEMGRAGRRRAIESFSWSAIAGRTKGIYDALV